jgi:methylglutaconyl-CoA hydratase
MSSEVLRLSQQGPVATVTLNRPEVRNALNAELIMALRDTFLGLAKDPSVRVVVLDAEGPVFCAGGDLHWMKASLNASAAENLADSQNLAAMFMAIYDCPKPVIAKIQGDAFGGGCGLVAVCDIAVASKDARFCFSEVKLGLVPAVISPYVLAKIGPGKARRYFLTAEIFNAKSARKMGLIHENIKSDDAALDDWVQTFCDDLLRNGPEAMTATKQLIDTVPQMPWQEALAYTPKLLAERRVSAEAQEGMKAFFEKRSPAWWMSAEPAKV